MQLDEQVNREHADTPAPAPPRARAGWKWLVGVAGVGLVLWLTFYNLTGFPVTWFDEGSHLHVPKTLLRFGVYADYSSEGFRYYGPTIGVGPTVMLPIAAVFKVAGIGLLQARLVMALYLLATIAVFFWLAKGLLGTRFAWVATALLVSSRGVALVEYGRQVLGEVPGFFFVLAALLIWFLTWGKAKWWQLGAVGLLFGLAMVTKNQYLLVLGPALVASWLLNLIYYRAAPQRTFLVPGIVAALCFAVWQAYMLFYLGPATASENLALLREASAGAAFVFSPQLIRSGLEQLLDLNVYLGWLFPVLLYGFFLVLPRQRDAQRWSILYVIIVVNLAWYVVASIGWLRYAFLGLALSSLFFARFFYDLTDGLNFSVQSMRRAIRQGQPPLPLDALRWVLIVLLSIMIVLPLAQTARDIASPAFNAPAAMAAYMDANVAPDALVETWEPEMGFLTDHNYHYPPQALLNNAVQYIWLGKTAPATLYDFVQTQQPPYVMVGAFGRWVGMYPPETLAGYELVSSIGTYDLYRLKE